MQFEQKVEEKEEKKKRQKEDEELLKSRRQWLQKFAYLASHNLFFLRWSRHSLSRHKLAGLQRPAARYTFGLNWQDRGDWRILILPNTALAGMHLRSIF
jgi:hypothetical protein